jgi:hypothetical protein
MFALFLEEIKFFMRLIPPVHDAGLTFREDTGNKTTLCAVAFIQEYFM